MRSLGAAAPERPSGESFKPSRDRGARRNGHLARLTQGVRRPTGRSADSSHSHPWAQRRGPFRMPEVPQAVDAQEPKSRGYGKVRGLYSCSNVVAFRSLMGDMSLCRKVSEKMPWKFPFQNTVNTCTLVSCQCYMQF